MDRYLKNVVLFNILYKIVDMQILPIFIKQKIQ